MNMKDYQVPGTREYSVMNNSTLKLETAPTKRARQSDVKTDLI